jgi:uncharacterized protein
VITEDQSEVIAYLSDQTTYGASERPVDVIETHGAIVFLTGDRAYKLKRAVWFEYMDFSTVDRRREFCAAEVDINSRTAPEIYLGARAIIRTSGHGLALATGDVLSADAEVIDWVVEMKRFDQSSLFDHMAEADTLTEEHMKALTDKICRFHEKVEIRRDQGGRPAHEAVIEANRIQFSRFSDSVFDPKIVEIVTKGALAELGRCADELDRRRQAGLVRHCHGDMHLRNICLFDGVPTLFDAIEFDEQIACVDVLYDLAFLLMDLVERDLAGFANIVFNQYLSRTAIPQYQLLDGILCMPLFLSCRAGVRAHVNAAMADSISDPGEALVCKARAREYLDAAARYLRPIPPQMIAVGGLSGTGKSCLADRICERVGKAPGAVWIRSDVVRKRLLGKDPLERLEPDAYSVDMNAEVYDAMHVIAEQVVRAGHSVVVDAVFAQESERREVEERARALGADFSGFWLSAPKAELIRRVTERVSHGGDASDATAEVLERQLSYDLGKVEWHNIDASGSKEMTLKEVARLLN